MGLDKVANKLVKDYFKKTAGEVRFIKDQRGDDKAGWAYHNQVVPRREITKDFEFKSDKAAPLLTEMLEQCTEALGCITIAYNSFAKAKSTDISPDGYLGGKGYIQKIVDMRKQFMNMIEALSSISDTIHDELSAEHWKNPDDRTDEDVEQKPKPSRELNPHKPSQVELKAPKPVVKEPEGLV